MKLVCFYCCRNTPVLGFRQATQRVCSDFEFAVVNVDDSVLSSCFPKTTKFWKVKIVHAFEKIATINDQRRRSAQWQSHEGDGDA